MIETGADPDLMAFSEMTLKSAQEFLFAFLTTEKKTEDQYEEHKEAIELWEKRKVMAQKAGRDDLIEKAQEQINLHTEQANKLASELKELNLKSKMMQEMLAEKKMYKPSVDAEVLQEQLSDLVGEEDSTRMEIEKEMEDDKAQKELEALRKELGLD